MPKLFGKEISTPVLALGGIGGVVVLSLLVSDMLAAKPIESSISRRKVSAKGKDQKANEPILESDYKAKFAVLTEKTKDAFQPLVVRKTAPLAPMPGMPGAPAPNQIPAELAGGEPTWAFTGYAEVNGNGQALIENTGSGDSVFLSPGEKWRNLQVKSISSQALIVAGKEGKVRSIPVGDRPSEQPAAVGVQPNGTVAPVDPSSALKGAIGAGTVPMTDLRVQPVGTAGDSVTADPAGQDTSRPSRRRSRRGQNSGN